MGTAGDYAYTPMHYYTVALVALVTVFFVVWQLQINGSKHSGRLIYAIAWFQIVFEILWRLVYLFIKKSPLVF